MAMVRTGFKANETTHKEATSLKLAFGESNYCKGGQYAKFTLVNNRHVDFRSVICPLHASYAYKSYWLCDRCGRDFMLKTSAAVNYVKT